MFYDSNDIQLSTPTDEVTSEDTEMKYKSWGWNVVTIDGHNHSEIRKALIDANNETEKPTLIIGKTIMGKGCVTADDKTFEGECELHGQPIGASGADYTKTLLNLGAKPESPFDIYDDVGVFYQNLLKEKIAKAADKKAVISTWRNSNVELANKLDFFLFGELPELDFESISHKAGLATRAASSYILGYLAQKKNYKYNA